MKRLIVILAIVALPSIVLGQFNPPGCSDLMVENIQMDDDTVNLMKITISNSCTGCTSGINGCVYLELQVVKTVLPFDTIAASNCWCKISPDNSSQKIYSVNSTVTSVPPYSDIRVSLSAGSCGCDTIPFNPALGILASKFPDSIRIYPNPVNDNVTIQNLTAQLFHVSLYNSLQEKIFDQALTGNTITLDLSHHPHGIYFYKLINHENRVTNGKIIKL